MSEWQPIETAPKDGRLLVVMQGDDGGEKWVESYTAEQLTYPGIKGRAILWQPLPEPPK